MIKGIFNLRQRSLLRGGILEAVALILGLLLADFPNNRPTLLLVFPILVALVGMVDHARCMQRTWSWYHGGVLLLIYMDMMVLSILLFFLLYPYAQWLTVR